MRAILQRLNAVLTSIAILLTMATLSLLLFLVVEALIGARSGWWLVAGPILVVPVLALLFTAWDMRAEILGVAWIRTLVEGLKSVRNVTALITLGALFREVAGSNAEAVADIWHGIGAFFWRILAG